ncbi:MAG: lysine--tRNA ligase [candidate division WOR-3 bacterium]|nr:lysine--tRNA ligase [candidate division WOR-3 bacterium]
MSSLPDRENRIRKLDELRSKAIEPYPYSFERTHTAAEALADFDKLSESETQVKVAGRLRTRRDFGKTIFFDLHDESGKIQLYIRKDEALLAQPSSDNALPERNVPPGKHPLFSDFLSLVDLGDFVGVSGPLFKTKTGEPTINVKEFTMLSKSLAALPEKYHGLQDTEQRLRKRHLDLLVNQETREVFRTRSRLINLVRAFFDERGFLEVETPMLQPLYGGAAAEPFRTHYRVLDRDYFLRIATELYLKRLIVGGFEKVYEIGKDFRNEGLDRVHNPEFTMLEAYQAYVDYSQMMRLTEELFRLLASELTGSTTVTPVTWMGAEFDFSGEWEKVEFVPALAEKIGTDPLQLSEDDLRKICKDKGVEVTDQTPYGKMLDKLFTELVQNHIQGPAFVADHPRIISPLAKVHRNNPQLVERFEPVIAGVEFGNAFSELNDPLEQRKRFEEQTARHEEFSVMDEDFLQVLEQGMPPTGGLGLGIDRMVMLFTDSASIRDVIIFPQLKEEGK